jgi:hypothetical protein
MSTGVEYEILWFGLELANVFCYQRPSHRTNLWNGLGKATVWNVPDVTSDPCIFLPL